MSNDYSERLKSQIDQYRKVENIHELPDIFHYWSNRHLRPRLNGICHADSIAEFYAKPLIRCTSGATRSDRAQLVSIGSGDCGVEIGVAQKMREMGAENFVFHCLELSPVMLERAGSAIEREGLADYFQLQSTDLDKWTPERRNAGAMANHSLHHLVELERIFDGLARSLLPGALFASNDMIGRNGHMRWPETLEFIDHIWRFIDSRYKQNRQLGRFEETFENWDCSTEGFVGIRAQDILPLLVSRFNFESLLAYGGIIDVFVDRAFGHNYDPESESDRAFIDFLQLLNDRLIDGGSIKPTMMFAVMSLEALSPPRCWRHWDPQFSVRQPV